MTCSRCGQVFSWQDDRCRDDFRKDHPALAGQDICEKCASQIEAAAVVAALSAAANQDQRQFLENWLKLYED